MSITIEEEVARPPEYSQKLRSELIDWEKAFVAAHDGRKPGRDDIKQHPEIASKYKEYNKLYRPLPKQVPSTQRPSSPRPPPPSAPHPTKKRKPPPSDPAPTSAHPPHKRHQAPPPAHPSTLDPYDSPRSIHLTPPPLRTSLGPTPQKNGQALGLFDLLSPSSSRKPSLSPAKGSALRTAGVVAQTTPSRGPRVGVRGAGGDAGTLQGGVGGESGGRQKRSPQSSSKRGGLDSFVTPSARRVVGRDEVRTPGSKRGGVSRLVFDETPEFLRRGCQRVVTVAAIKEGGDGGAVGLDGGEEEVSWSPVAVRMPRKAVGRGLSVLVKGLRGLEEAMWDEEMDVLREVEAEEGEAGLGSKAKGARVLVMDSQVGEMPLGADGEGEEEEESEDEEAGKGRDGRAGRVWKKKGQKRSTRRVVMKPVTGKWKPEPEWKGSRDSDDGEEVVVDTQGVGAVATPQDGEDGGDTADGHAGTADPPTTLAKKGELVDATVKSKRAPRKISSTAHANYRALKIKNKHSKGKGVGKFGRRR